jgi:hypothetical protein
VSEHRLLFTLFGLNRAGRILYGVLIVLIIPAMVGWFVVLPRMRFQETDEALFKAARHGDVAGIMRALDEGGRVNGAAPVDGKTAIFRAAVFGHGEAVRALVSRGADLSLRGSDGQTVLEYVTAIRSEEKDAAKLKGLDEVLAGLRTAGAGR